MIYMATTEQTSTETPESSTSTVTSSKEVSLNTSKVSEPSSVSTTKKETSPAVWMLVGMLIALILGGIAVYLLFSTGNICRIPGFENSASCEVVENDDDSENEESMTITSPREDATVNGKIDFVGSYSSNDEVADAIDVVAYDSEGNVLGSGFELVEESGDGVDFSGSLIITTLPAGETGYLSFDLSNKSDDLLTSKRVNIKFDLLSTGSVNGQERLRLSSPMEDQYIGDTDMSITLEGQMKDFFEAHMNFRIVDDSGKELYEGFVTATGDNYGQFANFKKVVEVSDLKLASDNTGKIIFYEASAKDGSETIVLELPVTLSIGE